MEWGGPVRRSRGMAVELVVHDLARAADHRPRSVNLYLLARFETAKAKGETYRPSPLPATIVWLTAEDVADAAPAKLLLSAPAEPAPDPEASSAVAEPDACPAPAEPKTELPPVENKPTRNP